MYSDELYKLNEITCIIVTIRTEDVSKVLELLGLWFFCRNDSCRFETYVLKSYWCGQTGWLLRWLIKCSQRFCHDFRSIKVSPYMHVILCEQFNHYATYSEYTCICQLVWIVDDWMCGDNDTEVLLRGGGGGVDKE